MKTTHCKLLAAFSAILLPLPGFAQVNSGSDGHDGALNPTANLVIDMADHPDGIYHYTSVNIPSGVTVSFIPNAANTPVVWLVQNYCSISGVISVVGGNLTSAPQGALGGPGGFRGGNGALAGVTAGDGLGPGGGRATVTNGLPGNASFATLGDRYVDQFGWNQNRPGDTYGSNFLVPLIGGSGGGGPGGGAIIIAANNAIIIAGGIRAYGGFGSRVFNFGQSLEGGGAGGSGGSIRLVATTVSGGGTMEV